MITHSSTPCRIVWSLHKDTWAAAAQPCQHIPGTSTIVWILCYTWCERKGVYQRSVRTGAGSIAGTGEAVTATVAFLNCIDAAARYRRYYGWCRIGEGVGRRVNTGGGGGAVVLGVNRGYENEGRECIAGSGSFHSVFYHQQLNEKRTNIHKYRRTRNKECRVSIDHCLVYAMASTRCRLRCLWN